ncbi:GNAT family N-acetyltransferase [Thermophagus xiamenensis]|uniref:Protein N-acetyltransferase, RimJ/RimL family n=1 Tax=Thermophagus xiamenensis TaxID=385682 RepID=A0A1I2AEU4_9BACT|nr:GNAT family protein [Thermophagus xiamenensis]SFE42392.1 Protein N-acetyltransferase, RimJ/RimL family [Thermophagus xiamenensis]
MKLQHQQVRLRQLKQSDVSQLAQLLNNPKILDNLRDSIPFPYFESDALKFVDLCNKMDPLRNFAIEYDGQLVGTIGLEQETDVYRLSGQLGYWIGEPFWGKGIATTAVNLMVDYGFKSLELIRIHACVFSFNKASQRVLEKNGFKLEGIFEKAVIKNNMIFDEYHFAKVNGKS